MEIMRDLRELVRVQTRVDRVVGGEITGEIEFQRAKEKSEKKGAAE